MDGEHTAYVPVCACPKNLTLAAASLRFRSACGENLLIRELLVNLYWITRSRSINSHDLIQC